MRFSLCLAALLMIAACDQMPRYTKPSTKLPSEFKTSGPWRKATPADQRSRGSWWQAFGDSKLTSLLKEAQAANPTLEAAKKRLDQARAIARADQAGLFPFLTLNESSKRTRSSGSVQGSFAGGRTVTRHRGTLDLSYELDLWGKNRSQARSSDAAAEAAEADVRSAMLVLQGELALDWFALRAQDAQLELLNQAIKVRQKALDLAQSRFKQGDTTQLDVAQAETELATAQAEAIGLEKKRAELEHAIAALLGKTPSELTLAAQPLSGAPPSIPSAVPSDLLERRPDIARAEREMAAQNALIGVARAALYPSIKLGLNAGTETSLLENLAKAASKVWGLGPEVQWPVFDTGKRKAEIEAARAGYEETAANYRETVINAMRETEDALSGISILARQAEAQTRTVDAAQRTVDLAQKRYEAGLVAYFEVLDAQRTLLHVQQEAELVRGDRFASTVMLIKALGGGW